MANMYYNTLNPVAINDAHKEKLCFSQVNTRFIEIEALQPLTFFIFLHNQLSHMKEKVCFKKVVHQIDSKNEQLLLSASSFQLLSTVAPCGKI